jgi:hypothetical protein
MSKDKFIAISQDGIVQVHGVSSGNYATLCGMDGADSVVGQSAAVLPVRPRIDCPQCFGVWIDAKRFGRRDFTAAGLRHPEQRRTSDQ